VTRARREAGGKARGLAAPVPTGVRARDGVPAAVGDREVESVLEEWVVEDRWWNGAPLRRRYFELVLVDGRNAVVFHDLRRRRWFTQPG
jgi:hypothetical protein